MVNMEVVMRSVVVDADRRNSCPRWQSRYRNRLNETVEKQGLIYDDEGVHEVASEENQEKVLFHRNCVASRFVALAWRNLMMSDPNFILNFISGHTWFRPHNHGIKLPNSRKYAFDIRPSG